MGEVNELLFDIRCIMYISKYTKGGCNYPIVCCSPSLLFQILMLDVFSFIYLLNVCQFNTALSQSEK